MVRCLAGVRELRPSLGVHPADFGDGERRLGLALAASVLMHLALLAPSASLLPVRLTVATQPLQARIHATDHRLVPSTALAGAPADRQRQTRSSSGDQPVRESGMRDTRSRVATAPVAQRSSWSAPATEPAPIPSLAPPAPNGVSAEDLRQYRVALAIAARRFKQYPLEARESRWEGRVEIALSASAGQRVPHASLVHSSGYRALDEQALSMVAQAAAVTPLPESLQGAEIRVLLPIEFSLEATR